MINQNLDKQSMFKPVYLSRIPNIEYYLPKNHLIIENARNPILFIRIRFKVTLIIKFN